MRAAVVDASVAVKWFVPEQFSEQAVSLIEMGVWLEAPELLQVELSNVLWKKTRRAEISRSEALEILSSFQTDVAINYASHRDLLAPAFELAADLEHSVYDCIYLALAIALECPLVTADRRCCDKTVAAGLGQHVCWIEDLEPSR